MNHSLFGHISETDERRAWYTAHKEEPEMSRLVDNRLGTFNLIASKDGPGVLFQCPECQEWLPLTEGHMNATDVIDHESKVLPGTFCAYQGSRQFGVELIATMQSRILVGYEPTRPESLPPMYVPSERNLT